MNKLREVLMLCVMVSIVFLSEAQNTQTIQNVGEVNVDELSDDQIKKFLDQVESSGYSEQQLELLAKARGMSSAQIAKLRQRIDAVRSGQTDRGAGVSMNSRERLAPNQSRAIGDRSSDFDPFGSIFPKDTIHDGLVVFGMDFFNNSDLAFSSNLNIATPKDYQLGPGDQVIIDIWGASEQNYQLDISPEGAIIIPSLGPIYLNGLSMERAENRIKARLKSIYSTLGENTFAQVSLGQIRTISVNIVGEVQHPGTYEVSSFTTAFNALYSAGGPTKNGSFREILVFRSGKQEAVLDAYNFLIEGKGQNIMLQDQDVLIVKPYLNRVSIEGEVKRPAYYELKSDETLGTLITYAGGFTEQSYTKSLSIRRNLTNRKTIRTVSSDEFEAVSLQNGDAIDVGAILNQFVGRVRVEGAFNHPGEFELKEGMKLSDVFDLADGLRADAFMQRGVIIRQNTDLSLSNLAFNPQEILRGNSDITLNSEDLIRVQSIFDLHEEFTVSIQGEVLKPGQFPYAEGMTVENLIYLANGFKETAAKSFVEVARRVTDEDGDGSNTATIFNFPIDRNLQMNEGDEQFVLEPFDLVVIRKSPFYEKQAIVEVEGEVQYPGKYALASKNERISDVLNRSGGLTKYAYAKGATLIRRTEYYITSEDEGDEAAKIRREELRSLLSRDTLIDQTQQSFKTQESIGIRLDEILSKPGSKFDMILKEGDVLSIPRELQTVRLRGEVLYPSTTRYDDSRSFKRYVSQAGGFTDIAKKNKSYVVYPNGSAERTKSFLWFKNYPKIEPGTEIIIPSKIQREKLSPQALISLTSGVATMSLVILRLLDQL